MKKCIALLLLACLSGLLAGCSRPNSLELDLSYGYGVQLKLLHLNASNADREAWIRSFQEALEDAEPLEKDVSLFAYYPDYRLEITEDGKTTAAVVDVNGDFIEFYYEGEEDQTVYRSRCSALEFNALINRL